MKKISLWMLALVVMVATARGQAVYQELHTFGGPPDGGHPNGSLVLSNGVLYGTVAQGGGNGGIVFSITTNSLDFQILYSLSSNGSFSYNGYFPEGTLLLSSPTLFGTTFYGGSNNVGVVFAVDTDGNNFRVVHSLNGTEGGNPRGAMVRDATTLYGMSSGSGSALFSVNVDGSNPKTLHSFVSASTNGANAEGSLVLKGATLFGMTSAGGSNGGGTLFSISTNGLNYKFLHNFANTITNGATPYGTPVLVGSTFFGMTQSGGSNSHGTVFSVNTNGTSFKLLHSFNNVDGSQPRGDVTVSGSTLFGLTQGNGTDNSGTAFMMNTNGSNFQVIYTFTGDNGSQPYGTFVLAGTTLFGMTEAGGTNIDRGTIFSLTVTNGFGPTVSYDLALAPELATNIVGESHSVVATVTQDSQPTSGVTVAFQVISGPNISQAGTATTDGNGQGTFTYMGNIGVGVDTIQASGLNLTGTATVVWISTNVAPVTHNLAIIKMKAPKKITLSEKKPNVVGKFALSIENLGTDTVDIDDASTLASLVTIDIPSLGSCSNMSAVLVTPTFAFPVHLASKKKLNLAYTAVFSCANDPLATSKTAAHNDYQVEAAIHTSVIGGTDSDSSDNVCPRPANPSTGDKGCGSKTGDDLFIDVVQK